LYGKIGNLQSLNEQIDGEKNIEVFDLPDGNDWDDCNDWTD
jgi:hypothetical protein